MAQFAPPVPKEPSFGTALARGIGAGASQGLAQYGDFAMKSALQRQKSEESNKLFHSLMPQKGRNVADQLSGKQKEDDYSLSPEQETILALQDPQKFNAYKHLKDERAKIKDKETQQENLKSTIKEMASTLLKGNLGYTTDKFLTSEGRRDAQYFDSLNVQLESIGKELVSKGVLSAPRFAFLISNLPSAGKSDASNAGALEAWADELGIARPEGLDSLYGKKKKSKAKSSSKTREMKDEQGNVYDIPSDMVEQAKAQGLM